MSGAFFIGLILGGLISWVITHVYYKKSSRASGEILNKLTDDVKETIRQDRRAKLSVRELNKLIQKKTIDPRSKAPLPYKACPKCGSTNLKGGEVIDQEHDEVYYILCCRECGWSEWTE